MTTRKEREDIKTCGIPLHLQKACLTGFRSPLFCDRSQAAKSIQYRYSSEIYSFFFFYTVQSWQKKYMNKYTDCTHEACVETPKAV